MRYILLICLLLPCAAFAQTQANYDHALARFVKFYNARQGDSIIKMWPADAMNEEVGQRMWGNEQMELLHNQFGKITTYKYLGIDTEDANPGLAVFETQFTKVGWKTTSLTIDNEGYLGTFRFIASSDGIDKLLKAKKK